MLAYDKIKYVHINLQLLRLHLCFRNVMLDNKTSGTTLIQWWTGTSVVELG